MRTQTVASCTNIRSVGNPGGVPDQDRYPELAGMVGRPWRLRVAHATLTIRPSRAQDLAAVARMHHRCSARTLLDRYRCGGRAPAVVALDRLLREPLTFVAEDSYGEIVAFATTVRDPRHGPHSAEVGVLVEDGWQRLGIAGELMSHVAGAALVAGFAELIAYPGTDVAAAQRLMIGVGRTRMVADEDMHLHTTVPDGAGLGLGAVRERIAG